MVLQGERRKQDLLGKDGRVASVTATAVSEAFVDWAQDAVVAGVL